MGGLSLNAQVLSLNAIPSSPVTPVHPPQDTVQHLSSVFCLHPQLNLTRSLRFESDIAKVHGGFSDVLVGHVTLGTRETRVAIKRFRRYLYSDPQFREVHDYSMSFRGLLKSPLYDIGY